MNRYFRDFLFLNIFVFLIFMVWVLEWENDFLENEWFKRLTHLDMALIFLGPLVASVSLGFQWRFQFTNRWYNLSLMLGLAAIAFVAYRATSLHEGFITFLLHRSPDLLPYKYYVVHQAQFELKIVRILMVTWLASAIGMVVVTVINWSRAGK